MEMTIKEGEILDFIKKYKYCKKEHIQEFIDNSQSVHNRIKHLLWQKEISILKDEIISSIREDKVNHLEKSNIVKILDVVSYLKNEDKINLIDIMDQPFYIVGRTKEKKFYYFTIVNKGLELIQLRLIDLDNRGGTVLILEDKSQISHLQILKGKVSKIIIYEDFKEIKKI